LPAIYTQDDGWRISFPHQDKIHHQPGGPTIPVHERVDRNQAVMGLRSQGNGMKIILRLREPARRCHLERSIPAWVQSTFIQDRGDLRICSRSVWKLLILRRWYRIFQFWLRGV
jgi:hypothetical protein